MPKRQTINYSSESAPKLDEHALYVYYCKYSGRHAFTTDVDIETLPVRRTDGARILNSQKHLVKLYLNDTPAKLIKRRNGNVERQHRLVLGQLPIAYKCSPESELIYVMDNAVTLFADPNADPKAHMPVPPCIAAVLDGNAQITIEAEDKASKCTIIKISADDVRIQITSSITNPKANEELLEFLSKAMHVRLAAVSITKGVYTRRKHVLVKGLTPQQVYDKIQHAMACGMGFTADLPKESVLTQ